MEISRSELAAMIDHTQLKPSATGPEIEALCKEALEWGFYSACVNSAWITLAVSLLKGSPVKVISVSGFPLGATASIIKCREVEYDIAQGAEEVDFVINVGWVKENNHRAISQEFRDLVKAASGKDLKVIIETSMLTDAEKRQACKLAVEAGIKFVKTSTGFAGPGTGAKVEDVRLMKEAVAGRALVKASAGIRDLASALQLIEAGADRLGTSAGVAIVTGVGLSASTLY